MTPSFATQMNRSRREVLLVDVADRLSAKLSDQKQLRNNLTELLLSDNNGNAASAPFEITMLNFDEEMQGVTINNQATLSAACQSRWGHNCHVAGDRKSTRLNSSH